MFSRKSITAYMSEKWTTFVQHSFTSAYSAVSDEDKMAG